MTDFLSAEQLIIDRLNDQLSITVLSSSDIAGVKEKEQITPAIHVLFGGHRPVKSARKALDITYQQTWIVVVAVRNVSRINSGQKAREDAGPIMHDVLSALQGWRPSKSHQPLKPISSIREGYSNGFLYYPCGFETELTLSITN